MRARSMVMVAGAIALAACTGDTGSGGPSTSIRAATTTTTSVRSGTPSTASTSSTTATTATTTTVASLTDVASLAAELSVVEAGIRMGDATPVELDALGRRQQLAYRAVNAHPEWRAELLALVSPVATLPLQFHLDARQAQIDHAAGSTPKPPPTTLPAFTIVPPLPADELLGYYHEAESATGVPWQYLAAIHFQETRMGRVEGVSSAGAVGPMQFLPATWAECCTGDPTDAHDAIVGAAAFLAQHGAPADMQAALDAYNPNSAYVGAVTAFAHNMQADPRAYFGYHGWQVFVSTSAGTVRLPVGYSSTSPQDAAAYVQQHPEDLLP